jgi:hypothetical protein
MDQITKKTPNPKWSLYWCFIKLQTRETVSQVEIFDPALWAVASQTFSLVPPPPPPSLCEDCILYTRIQCIRGGGVVWGSGPQTDKHLSQSNFTGNFFLMTTFCIAFYESYVSMINKTTVFFSGASFRENMILKLLLVSDSKMDRVTRLSL